jgi:hypothetical protein
VVVVSFVKKSSCVGEDLVAIVDSQPGSHDGGNDFSVVHRPSTIGRRVGLAGSNFLFDAHIPDFHFSTEISEPSETEKPSQVSPNDFVLVLFSELEDDLILLVEKDGLGWHEPADDEKVFSLFVPHEIMDGARCSFNLGYLALVFAVDVETELSVVGFACGVEVSLEFNEEGVFSGTELNDDLFSFVDDFFVGWLFLFVVEELEETLVCFFVQEDGCNEVALDAADEGELKEIKRSRFDDSLKVGLFVIDFDGLVIVSEEEVIITRYLDQGIAGLVIVVALGILLEDCHFFKGLQVDDQGLPFIGVHLFQNLKEFLSRRQSHRINVAAVFF